MTDTIRIDALAFLTDDPGFYEGRTLVCYHANCSDGFAAAWVAQLAIPSVVLLPCFYGQKPPDTSGKIVFVLDFSWDELQPMLEMGRAAAQMTVIDHHKTAGPLLRDLILRQVEQAAFFDVSRSGARLALDYFFPRGNPDIEWLIDYVQDRDLGRRILPGVDAVSCYLDTLEYRPELWSEAARMGPAAMIQAGAPIVAYQRRLVSQLADRAELVELGGMTTWAANASVLWSLVASEILARHGGDFALTYRRRQDGRWEYSLASAGDFDVSVVAQKYGGGGHHRAAGFETDRLIHRPLRG